MEDAAAYRDPRLPDDARARDLLGRMTRAEKVAQLCSVWLNLAPDGGEFAPHQGTFAWRKADAPVRIEAGIGQISRPLGSRPVSPHDGARALAAFQERLVRETRLGIPAIAHEECLTGLMAEGATQFPSPLAYGATWDPELIEEVADAIRRQMRALGAHQGLAPVADVIRDARWGRVEECVSEDPYLVGSIVTAYVRGLQGEDLRRGVVATLKHFAGYSGSEGGRNFAPAHMGPRELEDVFLVPFEMAVKAGGARSVMNAYQEIDGEPPAASRRLLTRILRERWGFDGVVVADYFAVKFLALFHGVAADDAEAAAAALGAGLDIELPMEQCYGEGLPEALERGLVDEHTLDTAVLRVLRLKLELGLLDGEAPPGPEAVALEQPGERALARRVAERSITLLANDGTLPLADGAGKLAVVGPNADEAMALFGNYSFQNHVASHFPDYKPAPVPTLLDAIRARAGADRVAYAQGCRILEAPGRPSRDESGIAEAVAAARAADVVVAVVGDRAGHFRTGTVGEGTDTDDLRLPGVQEKLVLALLDAGRPLVLVLLHGRPFALDGLVERCGAVVAAWFPGQDGAAALAGVLFGDVEPSGRSPVTWSRGAGVQPIFYNHKPLARGVPNQPGFAPVFAFGHGLSYTRFAYADLALPEEAPVDGVVEIACSVRNVGERAGTEVVQLYVRDEVASVTRPVQELRGFARVALEPGRAARVRFRLPADMLCFSGPEGRRIVEPGTFRMMLGASSEDVRLEDRFRLTGKTRTLGEGRALFTAVAVEPLAT